MARINIEDSLLKKKSFEKLIVKLGDRRLALGAFAEACFVAQQYWKYSDHGIPKPRWVEEELAQELIDCGLAEDRGDFVYLKGSRDHFEWLRQRSKAGKKGGSASIETIDDLPKQIEANESNSKPLTLSLSLKKEEEDFFKFNDSSHIKKKEATRRCAARPAEAGSPVKDFIAGYCDAFKLRYGTHPPIQGKEAGIAKRLVEGMGLARANELVKTFVTMNEPFYLQRRHDLATFESNLTAIVVRHDTGKTITRKESYQAETQDYYRNQIERIERGEI